MLVSCVQKSDSIIYQYIKFVFCTFTEFTSPTVFFLFFFLMESLGFSINNTMSSINSDSFTSFFPFGCVICILLVQLWLGLLKLC